MKTFQTSQRCLSSLRFAAYDYWVWNFVRLTYLGLVSFDFGGTRGNANQPCSDNRGFADRDDAFIIVHDPDSFANSTTTYRRPFQKSESAFDRSGSDGWACLGHCDRST
jgi:hypothetical protein